MRIAMVHFLAGVREGGTENIAKNLARELVDLGHDVDIYTNKGDASFPEGTTMRKMPYIWMPLRHLRYLSMIFFFSLFAALNILFRRYDIVHGFFYADSYLPFVAAKLTRKKIVYTFGGVLDKEAKTGKLADKCVALASAIKDVYEKLGVREIEIIPNGVDTARFVRDENARKEIRGTLRLYDRLTMLTVARPDEIKGPGMLASIIEKCPDVNFLLVGISEAEPLKSMNAKNAIKLGKMGNEDAKKYYSAADCFLLTSRSEGMPTVLVEALSSGLPVIATKVGGVPDVVDHRVGFLIEQDPTKAAALINRLAKEKATLDDMRGACRAKAVKNYDWKILAKKYEELYRDVIGGKNV
ncbi:MAG: glycosyltransferase family 4 protein [Candidatus Aenigmarchaeota archaeon]|nr:glycosyltransferase family 4 protein [Candidatus Aenigmarchaeota archaeon]